ncbi:MAG TPA: hypothetical protein VFD51_03900 [Patescibacteria group bacterium]|nr:hypothetical protein [Patescibacteria group bacterium]
MMSKYSKLLYTLFILLFIASLLLLFFRQPFIDYFREKIGVTEAEVVIRKSLPPEELINTEILSGETLSFLTDQVSIFEFDNICGESINAPRACVTGNANPFVRK